MTLPVFTVARVTDAREVGSGDDARTLLDIEVQTEGGPVPFRNVETSARFVKAGELLTGAMIGDRFEPLKGGSGSMGSSFYARINSSTQYGPGQFRYTWQEVVPDPGDPGGWTNGTRSNETDGLLYNGLDAPNDTNNVLGSGINRNNLTGSFAPVPLMHFDNFPMH